MSVKITRGRESGWVAMAVVIVLVVAAVGGVGVWFALEKLGGPSEDADDGFETPAWEDVRQSALPLAVPDAPEDSEPGAGEGTEEQPARPGVDPRVLEIGENLNKQFARNTGQETAFTDAYPRRALESWIKERAGIPADRGDHFMDSLVAASRGIGEDPVINRIGSVPDRVKAVQDALFAYRDEYLRRVEAVAEAEAAAEAERLAREERFAREDRFGREERVGREDRFGREERVGREDRFGREERVGREDRFGREERVGREDRFEREGRFAREESPSRRFASAERVRRIEGGPSMAHFAVIGVGVLALIVMLALIFTGRGSKRVQAAQAEP